MTGQPAGGDSIMAWREAAHMAASLTRNGFRAKRTKLKSVPLPPAGKANVALLCWRAGLPQGIKSVISAPSAAAANDSRAMTSMVGQFSRKKSVASW
jgi:hypothetical protein